MATNRNSFSENLQPGGTEEVISSLETLILLLTSPEERNHPKHLKIALKCAVRLCEAKPEYCDTFVDLLGSRLDNIDSDYTIVICEALGAVGSLKPETLLPQLPAILNSLRALSGIENNTETQTSTKIMLCTLVFQLLSGYKWNEETRSAIFASVNSNDLWSNYCIGWYEGG